MMRTHTNHKYITNRKFIENLTVIEAFFHISKIFLPSVNIDACRYVFVEIWFGDRCNIVHWQNLRFIHVLQCVQFKSNIFFGWKGWLSSKHFNGQIDTYYRSIATWHKNPFISIQWFGTWKCWKMNEIIWKFNEKICFLWIFHTNYHHNTYQKWR